MRKAEAITSITEVQADARWCAWRLHVFAFCLTFSPSTLRIRARTHVEQQGDMCTSVYGCHDDRDRRRFFERTDSSEDLLTVVLANQIWSVDCNCLTCRGDRVVRMVGTNQRNFHNLSKPGSHRCCVYVLTHEVLASSREHVQSFASCFDAQEQTVRACVGFLNANDECLPHG